MEKLELNVPVEDLRKMVRVSHEKLDSELEDLKMAFLADLSVAGVCKIPEDDSLAKATLRLYLRWQENYNGEAERYHLSYEATKIAMSLAGEYRGVSDA